MTTCPCGSMPRRPARPAICWNSFGMKGATGDAIELAHPANNDRAGGHIHAQGQGIGGEDDAHEGLIE